MLDRRSGSSAVITALSTRNQSAATDSFDALAIMVSVPDSPQLFPRNPLGQATPSGYSNPQLCPVSTGQCARQTT